MIRIPDYTRPNVYTAHGVYSETAKVWGSKIRAYSNKERHGALVNLL